MYKIKMFFASFIFCKHTNMYVHHVPRSGIQLKIDKSQQNFSSEAEKKKNVYLEKKLRQT
jgi:hypothetical protein